MRVIPSYPKVWALGHPAIADLLQEPVLVQEKIDGSQFSFCLLPDNTLLMHSHRAEVFEETAGMFKLATQTVNELKAFLTPSWIYRAEYLAKPKHNALAYQRVPLKNLILYDIETGPSTFLPWHELAREAYKLGLEVVNHYGVKMISSLDTIKELLNEKPLLGGPMIEGVVIKNYGRWGVDGKVLMGKYVSEKYKETHNASWKTANPSKGDIIWTLGNALRVETRWEKAVQRFKEEGKLTNAPQDIGPLILDIQDDVLAEEFANIQKALFDYAWPQIKRRVIAGFPEWYKMRLAKAAFEGDNVGVDSTDNPSEQDGEKGE